MNEGRVHLIDDDPVISRVVQTMLGRQGFEITCCADAREGIARAQASPPDMILLDIQMPGLDGIEACRLLRSRLPQVPIMFFSARAKEHFIEEGFAAGAFDYLEKPFSEAELVARVANLTRLARHQQKLRVAAEELQRKNDLLSKELTAARRMQWAFLPSSLALHRSLDCAVLYEPVEAVGGDLYDVSLGPEGILRFLVADVSGHGVVAALLASFVKMGYQVYSDREPGPAGVLQSIHRELCRALDTGDFVTALAGWFDPVTGMLRYASAGHVPGLLYRRAENRIERLLPTGPMMGILEESRIEEATLQLHPGDALALLTDGILEISGADAEIFGLRQVEAVFSGILSRPPSQVLQELRTSLDRHAGTHAPEDDLTALVLAWQPAGVPAAAFPDGSVPSATVPAAALPAGSVPV